MRNDLPEMILVYCTRCNKTHAAYVGETPCAPGAWFDADAMIPLTQGDRPDLDMGHQQDSVPAVP